MVPAAIKIDRLGFKYVGRRQPTLHGISLQIQAGESVLVLGPSGCGKSTLALCLNGAIPHALEGTLTGSVSVEGLDTRRASTADLAQRVGIVFQDPEAQFCMLNVEDEVAFGLENLAVPRHQMDRRIDDALGQVGLLDRRTDRIERLSGGQKQRLALACVLALEPTILVLDEPTAQLDPAGAADLIALLGELRADRRHTLVIVEHRLDEVMPLVDRVVVLDADGQLIADGPPREVMRRHGPSLAEAGVWTPQVSGLAFRADADRIGLDPFPLTIPEAAAALRPFVRALNDGPPSQSGPLPQPLPLVRERGARVLSLPSPSQGEGVGGGGSPLLQVSSLTYQYPRASQPVLQDVSFEIQAGELVAIVGANGAGKSTLARSIAGIITPPSGAILVNGRDVAKTPPGELARQVGYVFQYPEHQFVGQTVADDVAYGPRRAGLPESTTTRLANAMLDDFGLLRLAAAHPFTLSHGEQRRLSVASMLVLGQQLLILDEPTFGQDQRNATMLLDKLDALTAEGRAIVVVSHDMRLVAERAQRVLVLVDGALAFDGPPAALFSDRDLLARAHLVEPPLWELSRRLGLHAPFADLDSAYERLRGAATSMIAGQGAAR